MTKFNVGDKVEGRIGSNDNNPVITGTVSGKENDGCGPFLWINDNTYWMYEENAKLVGTHGRPLVGPRPAEAGPIFETPFTYDGDDCIRDARGRTVLQIAFSDDDFPGTDDGTWDAFGKYVALSLSERAAE